MSKTKDALRDMLTLLVLIDSRLIAACPDIPRLADAAVGDSEYDGELHDVGSMLRLGFGDAMSKAAWRAAEIQMLSPGTDVGIDVQFVNDEFFRAGVRHPDGAVEWFDEKKRSMPR